MAIKTLGLRIVRLELDRFVVIGYGSGEIAADFFQYSPVAPGVYVSWINFEGTVEVGLGMGEIVPAPLALARVNKKVILAQSDVVRDCPLGSGAQEVVLDGRWAWFFGKRRGFRVEVGPAVLAIDHQIHSGQGVNAQRPNELSVGHLTGHNGPVHVLNAHVGKGDWSQVDFVREGFVMSGDKPRQADRLARFEHGARMGGPPVVPQRARDDDRAIVGGIDADAVCLAVAQRQFEQQIARRHNAELQPTGGFGRQFLDTSNLAAVVIENQYVAVNFRPAEDPFDTAVHILKEVLELMVEERVRHVRQDAQVPWDFFERVLDYWNGSRESLATGGHWRRFAGFAAF